MSKLNLAIKPKGKADRIVRVNIGIKQSILDDIALYVKAYEEAYGEEITDKEIINDVLGNFFAREKSFHDWKQQNQAKLKAAKQDTPEKSPPAATKTDAKKTPDPA